MDVQERIDRLSPAQRALLTRRLASVAGQEPSNGTDPTDRLVAYLVCRNGSEPPEAAELRRHLAERLPRFMVPSAFIPVDALPVLPNGKVDREALAQRKDSKTAEAAAAHAANHVEAQLMRIWDDLIDVPDVGRHDNFFELGGHSLLLPRLIDRVQRDFGVTLPLGTVFQTPTLSGLAELIQAGNPTHSWRSLVGIRVSGQRPPLYMVHGLGGEIGYFYNLAEYLDRQQPVFGLQAPLEPFDDITAMASHYLDEIRSHQPNGPYLLGGYCIGGVVAFEMAQQLVASGEAVRLLAIVDAAMPGPQSFARRLKRFVAKGPRQMAAVLRSRAQRLTARLAAGRSAVDDEIVTFYGVPHAFLAAAAKHYRARSRYAPRPYDGDAWVFRSEHPEFDADLGWGPLVRGTLEVRTVPGRHANVLKEPNLKETARQLAAAVDAAAASDP
jgi:thioesterase domain-containing protein